MTTTKRAPARGAAKGGTAKSGARKAGAAKSAAKRADNYTDPALRERLKRRITAGTKGGRAGQWSARKAQLLAHEYEAHGGGYTGAKTATQRHLGEWTREEWTTADGAPARRGGTTARYLPKAAWAELTPAQRRSTDKKKRAASKRGEQFAGNTEPAAAARRRAEGGTPAKRPATKRPATKRSPTKQPAAKRAAATKRAAGTKRAAAKPSAAKRPATRRPAATRATRGR